MSLRRCLAFAVVAIFVLLVFLSGLSDHVYTVRTSLSKNVTPDFSRYNLLRTLSPDDFPIDDPQRRVIIVGDIHGMHHSLISLLNKLNYEPHLDVLIHVGDIVTRGPIKGSLAVLSFLSTYNIRGVRGNNDQKVIEWRGWLEWIRSLPGGQAWLADMYEDWLEAEADGATLEAWMKKKRKRGEKWWRRVPKGWKIFEDHYKVAEAMSEEHYQYLLDLPLTLHVPSAHTLIVHAGLLSSNPQFPPDNYRQPLSRVPHLPPIYRGRPSNETVTLLRELQERALLKDVPQNRIPWNILNMRSINHGRVSKKRHGTAWSDIWKYDMSLCEGFYQDVLPVQSERVTLPCYPLTVVYGHTAARGLDVKRWSFGLDTGCAHGRRLTALVLGGDQALDVLRDEGTVAFGDQSAGSIVSIGCK